MNDLLRLNVMLNSLTIYKNLRNDVVINNLQKLCNAVENKQSLDAFLCYSNICERLFSGAKSVSMTDYIFDLIAFDDNLFSRACAKNDFMFIDYEIIYACEFELTSLQIVSQITSADLKNMLLNYLPDADDFISTLPEYKSVSESAFNFNWGKNVTKFAELYLNNGVGIFAKYRAFNYIETKGFECVYSVDKMKLSDFMHYETQRNAIVSNTINFIQNKPFNNVLLYGDRGTGKSSTVKALLNEFSEQGLRIIQVAKSELGGIGNLVEQIKDLPLKFIIFIDDIVFNENDDHYNLLKGILEGGLAQIPTNVAFYATTNRRHIIKESFSSREGNEVHITDTIDENLSLTDRFGLFLTFSLPNKDTYLDIVKQMAKAQNIEMTEQKLFELAERFALKKASRSPRVAKQFINSL